MYAEWASLQGEIETDSSNTSVLHSFPQVVGRDVAGVLVRNLAQNLTIGASNSEPSKLMSAKQVKWTMEVLCYGLSLPLNEFETIRDCVHVYCEWMSALTVPKKCVPRPVVEDPNPYIQMILHHLLNVFLPREEAVTDQIQRQVVMCHRVLRAVEAVASESLIITKDTWHVLLQFLLAVNDALLAPPTVKGGIGDQLCERVVSVLFKLWLLACARNFPSPPLWKTFREMCGWWRHHEPLVTEWHRVNMVLTSRLLKFTYGPDFPELLIAEDDQQLIPDGMDNDCVAQSWFRFLHLLSNPVDLSRPHVISNTPKFLHMALSSEQVLEPHQHECLRALPYIFFKAMKGLSLIVDAFLGISQSNTSKDEASTLSMSHKQAAVVPSLLAGSTPPSQRKLKTFTLGQTGQYSNRGSGKGTLQVTHSLKSSSSSTSSIASTSPGGGGPLTLESRLPLANCRPRCNSILHMFGAWLFEAGLAGVTLNDKHANPVQQFRRTSSFLEKELLNHHHSNTDLPGNDLHEGHSYEAGRAEACGALCRIICSHKTGEEITPVYLSRFYLVLFYALKVDENISGQVLANVIFNSCDLLKIDLDGVQILLPYILKAIDYILGQLALRFRGHEQIAVVELRKASIHLLLSMLCLPLHFKSLKIKAVPGLGHEPMTFLSLKTHLIELLLKALLEETDSANTQMLLGGLLLCVQDLAVCEAAEARTLQDVQDLLGAASKPPAADTGVKTRSPTLNGETDGGGTYKPPTQLKDCDTARGLFGQASSLVCNRLMASWKMDLNIALAAMEVLSGLAKIKLNHPNMLMCKRTVKWICDFIVYQCSRPAPAHSKDLHSMIVAAFNCLTVWLVEHSFLLQDKECLHCVLEVVELGISGSKSQPDPVMDDSSKIQQNTKGHKDKTPGATIKNRASDVPKLKGDKELKPASMRVKDAAEALLTTVMEHVGSFPPPCGPESLCSLLDEESLLKYCGEGEMPQQSTPFRYFVIDNTVIIGLLEQPLGNEQDPLPTVTALIRGPFGRHAWTMQLRHLPRQHKMSSRAHLVDPGRPVAMENVGVHHNIKHRYFPQVVDTIHLVKADKSIPTMSEVIGNRSREISKLNSYIQQQVAFEADAKERLRKDRETRPFPDPKIECKQPSICHEFQTARLFLSQFNFLSLEALKEPTNSSLPPSLVMLDTKETGFHNDFVLLDNIPSRASDTAFLFYVKPGQKMPFEILHNVTNKTNVQPVFLEFLRSLGWPVDVRKHPGWTGHVNTSWKISNAKIEDEDLEMKFSGGGLYDGKRQVLYWADVCSEVAFVVPSPNTYCPRARSASLDFSHVSPVDRVLADSLQRNRSLTASYSELPGTDGSSQSLRVSAHPLVKLRHKLSPSSKRVLWASNKRKTLSVMESSELTVAPSSSSGRKQPAPKIPSILAPFNHDESLLGDNRSNKPQEHSQGPSKPQTLALNMGNSKPNTSPKEQNKESDSASSTNSGRKLGRHSVTSLGPDTKVFIVWLESYEDFVHFPASELLQCANTGLDGNTANSSMHRSPPINIIFIHALRCGLFRIHLQGHIGRISAAIPLVDGMVISRRVLGTLVRQTVINISKRKRLESDSYQPPHVRRKLKIQEIVHKYRNKLIEPEFYTTLFQDPTTL